MEFTDTLNSEATPKIIRKFVRRFKGDPHILESAAWQAAWNAAKLFDPQKSKWTSFLSFCVLQKLNRVLGRTRKLNITEEKEIEDKSPTYCDLDKEWYSIYKSAKLKMLNAEDRLLIATYIVYCDCRVLHMKELGFKNTHRVPRALKELKYEMHIMSERSCGGFTRHHKHGGVSRIQSAANLWKD